MRLEMEPMNRMNSISQQQKTLFEDWRQMIRSEPLVFDGVRDQAKYWNSPRRLLFVLKEANYPGSEEWDLKDYVAEWGKTWNNITRWTRAIHALPDELPWERLSWIDKGMRLETLDKIAFMNLNKRTGGTGTANSEKIEAVVENDKDFIHKQIAIYRAKYVICCGQHVAGLTRKVILGREANRRDWRETKRGVRFMELPMGGHLIDYLHPQARGIPATLLCFHLVDAIREIEQRQ